MCLSVAQFYWPSSLASLEDWFPLSEVSLKRDQLAALIRSLAEEQRGEEVQWPNINFLDPAPGPRARRKKVEECDEEEQENFLETVPGSSSRGATSFYGRSTRSCRGERGGEELEELGMTGAERARRERHRDRDIKAVSLLDL